jgi:hypothetical protein
MPLKDSQNNKDADKYTGHNAKKKYLKHVPRHRRDDANNNPYNDNGANNQARGFQMVSPESIKVDIKRFKERGGLCGC